MWRIVTARHFYWKNWKKQFGERNAYRMAREYERSKCVNKWDFNGGGDGISGSYMKNYFLVYELSLNSILEMSRIMYIF